MTEPLRFAIAGVAGRMGRQLVRSALHRGHEVCGGTELPDSSARDTDIALLAGLADPVGILPSSDPVDAATEAQVWIDFTTPQATLSALQGLRHSPVGAVIIGTTGFSVHDEAQIAAAAEHFAIVKAGNFSLGVNLLSVVTRLVASRLGADWDVEISETHHRHKADAPSGTALMLGAAAAEGRGQKLKDVRRPPYDGAEARRQPGEIGFAVSRAGGVVGTHEAVFASEAELIRLGHQAMDRGIFADGAVTAGEWAAGRGPGLYDMEDVLGLKGVSL